MIRSLISLTLAASFGFGLAMPAHAQEGKPGEPKKEEPKQDPKTAEYEKAIKDLKKIDGNLTLYLRKKEILLELPESKLGKILLLQASFNTGAMGDGLTAGFPVGDFTISAFRFDKQEDAVWMIRPNIAYRWNPGDPLSTASVRSFPEAILGSFRIEQTNPDKKLYLVNITNLFWGDAIRMNEGISMLLGGPYQLDREKSGPESVKSFPDNTNVQMKLHFFSPRGNEPNPLLALLGIADGNQLEDTRSAPVKVTFNLWWRRDSDYTPRVYDPRVGFFTADYFDVAKFLQDDRNERYINRWNLQKKDPSAKLSEPIKPIVWYVDNSVPPAYREAMKNGILYWNKAFESLGYKNALEVRMAPDNDPEWDHADGRYNVLRWTMSPGASYAIALARTDPFTGEILNASVNFDANMLYAAFREQDRFAMPGSGNLKRAMEVLTASPERDYGVTTDAYLWEGPLAIYRKQVANRFQQIGWNASECSFARGKAESAAFAWMGLGATGKKISRDSYAKEFLTEIAAHEVGHTLGLRHNFIASTRLSTAQLADDSVTSRLGNVSSVMEYSPVNIMAVLTPARNFFSQTIGEYDQWAIRYGYEKFNGAASTLAEKPYLAKIAADSGRTEHRFMSDEQADSFDPYAIRFDHAKDPVTYSARVLQVADNIRKYAITQLPRPGENYAKRTQMIMSALMRTFREGRFAARFVGGIAGNKSFKGDPGAGDVLRPVSAAEQRQAVRLVAKHCFGAEAFNLPESVLVNLQQDYADGSANGWTAPLREQISTNQQMLFTQLMSVATTKRIVENAFKLNGHNAYTLDEHYATLLGATFSEVGQNASIAPLRRDLQRFAVSALITQAGAAPGGVSEDVRMLASDSLRRLSARFGTAAKASTKLDAMTRIHFRDSKETIDRFLARTVATAR